MMNDDVINENSEIANQQAEKTSGGYFCGARARARGGRSVGRGVGEKKKKKC